MSENCEKEVRYQIIHLPTGQKLLWTYTKKRSPLGWNWNDQENNYYNPQIAVFGFGGFSKWALEDREKSIAYLRNKIGYHAGYKKFETYTDDQIFELFNHKPRLFTFEDDAKLILLTHVISISFPDTIKKTKTVLPRV